MYKQYFFCHSFLYESCVSIKFISSSSSLISSCMLCVALLMCLFVLCVACLTVFVNCLVKQFAMCVSVVAILLLNVMDVFSVCGGALLDIPCMVFQKMCVLWL